MTDSCPPAPALTPLMEVPRVHWSSAYNIPVCPLPPRSASCCFVQTLLSSWLASAKRSAPPDSLSSVPLAQTHLPTTFPVSEEWCLQHSQRLYDHHPLSTGGSWCPCIDAWLPTSHSWHCLWLLWGHASSIGKLHLPLASPYSRKACHIFLHLSPSGLRAQVSTGPAART